MGVPEKSLHPDFGLVQLRSGSTTRANQEGTVAMGERKAEDPPFYYETHIFVCTNRRPDGHKRGSCAARGSEPLRDYMKARAKELGLNTVRVNSAGCLDRCELGPCVVLYPEGVWYHVENRQAVDTVLERHLLAGERAEVMLLPPETHKG